jgi:hypothetical protein
MVTVVSCKHSARPTLICDMLTIYDKRILNIVCLCQNSVMKLHTVHSIQKMYNKENYASVMVYIVLYVCPLAY